MAKCHFRLTNGDQCGEITKGKKRKCPEHLKSKCSECESPAWISCGYEDCEAVLCRDPQCIQSHMDRVHGGVEPKRGSRSESVEKQRVEVEASRCPHCNEKVGFAITVKSVGKKSGYAYVICDRCLMQGPVSQTIQLAIKRWDGLPRGRPPIYERIRNSALALIDKELENYLEHYSDDSVNHSDDCLAIAKMLEAATMCVDTWEM